MRYRLERGERFAIVAEAELALTALLPRRTQTLARGFVRYVLDCTVAEEHPDETVTLEGRLRSAEGWLRTPLEGRGQGEGTVVADPERGKVARSQRAGRVTFQLQRGERPWARFQVELRTDAWHEDRPVEAPPRPAVSGAGQ